MLAPVPGTAQTSRGPRGERHVTASGRLDRQQLLLTAEQAASALRVGRTTLYALIKDGQLRSVHIGRSGRLTRAELLRYVHRLDSAADVPRRKGKVQRIALEQPGRFDEGSTPPDAA